MKQYSLKLRVVTSAATVALLIALAHVVITRGSRLISTTDPELATWDSMAITTNTTDPAASSSLWSSLVESSSPHDIVPGGSDSISLHDSVTDGTDAMLDELESALRRAAEMREGEDRRGILAAACTRLAQHDPAAAVALADRIALDDGPAGVMECLLQAWAEKDFSAAYAWTVDQPMGDARDAMLARVVFARSQTEPAQAAALVAVHLPPGAAQEEATVAVLHQWALRDPGAALSWLERFPEGSLRDRALQELESIAARRLASLERLD